LASTISSHGGHGDTGVPARCISTEEEKNFQWQVIRKSTSCQGKNSEQQLSTA